MSLSRRTILRGIGALPLLAGDFRLPAFAETAASVGEIPPMLFVHGNGDHAAVWITTLWRMESNGVPRERMFAINFTDPLARADDKVAQPDRSSTEDQRRELSEAIAALKRKTAASRRAGRQFARRQRHPQLHQAWRKQRRQPCRAVRRSQSRRFCLG